MEFEELAKWNDEMVKKYHSEGTLFESANPILRYIEKTRAKTIIKFAKISSNDTAIDVGCGEGYMLSLFPKAQQIIGFDISNVALERARSILNDRNDVEFIKGDGQNIQLDDNSFDVTICSEMLEHVPEPKRVISELHRILKPGGRLVVSIPDEKRIKRIMNIIKSLKIDRFLHAARKQETYEWHLHEFDMNVLKSISDEYFSIKKVRRIPMIIGYRFVVKLEPKK